MLRFKVVSKDPIDKRRRHTRIIETPGSWEECNLETFIRVQSWDGKEDLELFTSITGIPYKTLNNNVQKSLENYIGAAISWINQPLDLERIPLPAEITINDQPIEIPKDLGDLTIGQKMYATQELRKIDGDKKEVSKEMVLQQVPVLIAIYLSPLYFKKDFDVDRCNDFKTQIVPKLPCLQAWPIYDFFLKKLNVSQKIGLMRIARLIIRLRKPELILLN